MSNENELEGLSGWLILVGIGIIISPIRIGFTVLPLYSNIITDGTWEALTVIGSEAYHPLWASILSGEVLLNIGLIGVWIYIAYLFFSKKKQFPIFYIGALLFSLTFIILDAFAIKLVLPNEPVFDPDTTKELFRMIIICLIWIPYMLVSKRVKATFVN
jgi:hypothetical protein